jgi:hypothetical protein
MPGHRDVLRHAPSTWAGVQHIRSPDPIPCGCSIPRARRDVSLGLFQGVLPNGSQISGQRTTRFRLCKSLAGASIHVWSYRVSLLPRDKSVEGMFDREQDSEKAEQFHGCVSET